MNWQLMSTLSVSRLGIRASDDCTTYSTLLGSLNKPFGDDVPDIDIKTLQLAIRTLEVPRRIGAAGANNQFATGQNAIELAVRRLGHTHGSSRSCE
jgi:hypothetical protein